MQAYKYAFIGAGPATLAALNCLKRKDAASSIVLEAGKVQRKTCPGIRQQSCSSCSESLCPILNGVGGASYGFGNKFCEFPASMHVAGEATTAELRQVDTALSGSLSHCEYANSGASFEVHTGFPHRKHYKAKITVADQYRRVIDNMADKAFSITELRSEFVVSDVKFKKDLFHINSSTGEQICATNVIFATGRSGHMLLIRILPKLGAKLLENLADVGFRIRTKTENFADQFFYQNDPKYKFDYGELGSARTFCACKGGMIVPVKFGRGFFADGAFARKLTKFSNVALMARSNEVIPYERMEEWCVSINSQTNHSLALGGFDCEGMTDAEIASNIKQVMPRGLSSYHDSIQEKLVDSLLKSGKVKLFSSRGRRSGRIDIVGPSIDRYWPAVDMSSPLMKEGRVGVIGDAVGTSRGIYQAMVAGALWAQSKNSSMHQERPSLIRNTAHSK